VSTGPEASTIVIAAVRVWAAIRPRADKAERPYLELRFVVVGELPGAGEVFGLADDFGRETALGA
jgi:hypothetical protein